MQSVWCKVTRNATDMGCSDVFRSLKYSVPEGLKFSTYLAQICRHKHVIPLKKASLLFSCKVFIGMQELCFYGLHPLNVNRWVYTETLFTVNSQVFKIMHSNETTKNLYFSM